MPGWRVKGGVLNATGCKIWTLANISFTFIGMNEAGQKVRGGRCNQGAWEGMYWL